MSGHSKWSTIKHKKAATDKKRGVMFSKLSRAIIVAAKDGGGDPSANNALATAIQKARDFSMPKDNIERAIQRGAGGGDANAYETVTYEGYGAGGAAFVVEALTDNRNRTASDVRAAFNKHGGAMGETNSVSFLFTRLGVVQYPPEAASTDAMLEAAIEAGADNADSGPDGHEITCAPDDWLAVRDALEARFGPPASTRLDWRPTTSITLDEDRAISLLKLVDALEENDDVQNVFANFEIPDVVMQSLSA